jgi:hypothetical protein
VSGRSVEQYPHQIEIKRTGTDRYVCACLR